MKVSDYQLVDIGLENAQYFQGFGISFTDYTNCVVGAGDNFAEAIDDALEQLAEEYEDIEQLETQMLEDEGLEEWPILPSAFEKDSSEDSELYYYVGIRVK